MQCCVERGGGAGAGGDKYKSILPVWPAMSYGWGGEGFLITILDSQQEEEKRS